MFRSKREYIDLIKHEVDLISGKSFEMYRQNVSSETVKIELTDMQRT